MVERAGVELALEVLECEIVTAAATGEAAEGLTGGAIAEGDEAIAGRDLGGGIEESLAKLVDGEEAGDGREVRADGASLAVDHVAGGALAGAEEEGAASLAVAGDLGVGGEGVQRDDEGDERIEGGGGKFEAGHAGGGNAVDDGVAESGGSAAAEAKIAGEAGALLGAAGIVAMAAGAELGIGLLDVGRGVGGSLSEEGEGEECSHRRGSL